MAEEKTKNEEEYGQENREVMNNVVYSQTQNCNPERRNSVMGKTFE